MSIRASIAAVLVVAGTAVGLVAGGTAGAATTVYYVAMGDSLGAGVGASPISNAYVNQIYQHELTRNPGLVLQNFSCSGATSGSVINGPNCGSATAQLAQATTFMQAHPGQIAFLTIDIGANDVDGCTNGTTINTTCITNGLNAINTNLPQILTALKSAYPGLQLYGMNYYDPFLAAWLTGASGQTLAQQSVVLASTLNSLLAGAYSAAGFPTADVATPFDTANFALTGSYLGQTEPQNVANICNWTHMCDVSDIHANNIGHAVLAQAFETLIDGGGQAADAPVNATAIVGNAKARVSWQPPPAGTAGVTGYVVTPYIGAVAQSAITFRSLATAHTVTNLTNGQTYTFTVSSKTASGVGPASAPSAAVIVGAPAAPKKIAAASGATTAATGTLTVAHSPASNHGSAVTQYSATCTSTDGGVTQSAVSPGAASTPITVAGATTGRTYTCTVTPANGFGTGPATTASNAVVVGSPAAPAKPTTTSAGAGSRAVAFKTPADNGDAVTGATAVCVSSNGGTTTGNVGSASPITVTGLTVGSSYTCTVSAINSRGIGTPSKASATFVA
jgi:lysophospholipase L1-like esterase